MTESHVFKVTANTIPFPFIGGKKEGAVVEKRVIEESLPHFDIAIPTDDKFPKGKIVRYFKEQRFGFMRDQNGQEVFFSLEEMDLIGVNGIDQLSLGRVVGYDMSRTSRGPRVKRMKIY